MSTSPLPGIGSADALARYTPIRKLGTGGMGTVYLARDEVTGKPVALKLLRADRAGPATLARIQGEFRAIASLHHDRIAAAHDFGYTQRGRLPYYTREYVQGQPLAGGPPGSQPPSEFLKPVLDLLDALEYLHAHGILHLDIHPGNLIVSESAERGAVLIDFGLIDSIEGSTAVTGWGAWSPIPRELRRGGKPGPATDVFLAGRLLLYRLTGKTSGEPALPSEVPGWGTRVTSALERILLKALAEDPCDRFSSATEFRRALEGVLIETESGQAGGNSGSMGHRAAARSSREPRDVLVGRSNVLERIDGAVEAVSAGKTAALWLTGPPGHGKTRLLREARLRAQLRGLEVVDARFGPAGGPDSTLREQLQKFGKGRREAFNWLEPLDEAHGGSPGERAARAVQAYFAEDSPTLVLCLDDVEHSDGSGCMLVAALVVEAVRRERAGAQGRGLGIFIASTKGPQGRGTKGCAQRLRVLSMREGVRLLEALLQPLIVERPLSKRALREAGGSPLRIRQIAHSLREEWSEAGNIPPDADIPQWGSGVTGSGSAPLIADATARRILDAMAVLGGPVTAEEIAAATETDPLRVRQALRQLERAEIVAARRGERTRVYHPLTSISDGRPRSARRERAAREIHARVARHLESSPGPSLETLAKIARHRLFAGDITCGRALGLSAARSFRAVGLLDPALRLLEDIARSLGAFRRERRHRLEVAEEISSLLDEMGAHAAGAELMEPFYHGEHGPLPNRDAVRVRRRLGVHLHRSGRPEEALRVFEEAERMGDRRRDLEDLVFIDSEVAELCTLRGAYDRAEEACRRGLERLRRTSLSPEIVSRMQVVLRGSLGHLELRRGRLQSARAELRRAAVLARRHAGNGVRAVILNNLGIVENQLNLFRPAAKRLHEAERLLNAAGERRGVMSIACNLAVIAAKQGRSDEAHAQMERASAISRSYPGSRHEFLVANTQGLVHQILGENGAAVECLEAAVALGRKVGDVHLTKFSEVHLAEAQVFCGRYGKALEHLRSVLAEATRGGSTLLERMSHARLAVVEALLGRARLARESLEALHAKARSGFDLLEAWNDLFAGLALLLLGEASGRGCEGPRRVFQALSVPAGDQFCLLGRLVASLVRGDAAETKSLARELEQSPQLRHGFLDVATPLVLAEAALAHGSTEDARRLAAEASGAIVGSSALELDAWLEMLKARLSRVSGDLTAARGHLHRSAHTRALLAELVPRTARRSFTAHSRFHAFAGVASGIERSPRLHHSTRRLKDAGSFEGLVGRTNSMLELYRGIDLLRDQELPVLIRGETGTGKDLVARAIHRTSARSNGPFLAIHCASLPEELLESELFGYEKGAFTGADEPRPGILESLAGGTLLLDEVGELSLGAQAKILRVVESGAARRVGGLEPCKVDVRFLASSTLDLRERSRSGAFRADLYYRLAAVELAVSPLRERKGDIALLARHILEKHGRRLDRPSPVLGDDAVRALERHDWPGNVRELEALLLRACLARPELEVLGASDIEPHLQGRAREDVFREELLEGRDLEELKVDLERAYLRRLFREVQGDLRKMMEKLGVKQSHLYAWLRRVGLDVRSLRRGI